MKRLFTIIAAVLLVGTAFADAIHDATAKGDLAGVQAELDKGVDVNTKGGAAAVPPLLLAALNGHMEVVELLINNGAEVNTLIKIDGEEFTLSVLSPSNIT